jgi:hypothetical protein
VIKLVVNILAHVREIQVTNMGRLHLQMKQLEATSGLQPKAILTEGQNKDGTVQKGSSEEAGTQENKNGESSAQDGTQAQNEGTDGRSSGV